MRVDVRLFLLVVAMSLGLSHQSSGQAPSVATMGAKDGPSLELLEFLGEWETTDGRWVDPTRIGQVLSPTTPEMREQGVDGHERQDPGNAYDR